MVCPGKKTLLLALVLTLLGVSIAGVAVLRFGNPQWHKYIYLFQAHVWPGEEPQPPSDFTGTWRAWWKNGQLRESIDFRNGRFDGEYLQWHPNGTRWESSTYQDDDLDGPTLMWNAQGQKRLQGEWRNNRQHGRWLRWDDSGNVVLGEWYLSGQPVTKDEYEAECGAGRQ